MKHLIKNNLLRLAYSIAAVGLLQGGALSSRGQVLEDFAGFDEVLDFSDGMVPPGWVITFPEGRTGRNVEISDNAFKVGDNTFADLDKDEPLPIGASGVQISFYCGIAHRQGAQIHLLMQDGSDFMVGFGNSPFNLDQTLVTAGAADAPNFVQNFPSLSGYSVLSATFRSNQISFTINEVPNPTPVVTEAITVPGLDVNQLKTVRLAAFSDTTGGMGASAYLQYIQIAALPAVFPSQFGNISTRLKVEPGNNVAIAGFIITGTQPKAVVIRGIGPSLENVGVSGALADPALAVHDSSGAAIAVNDDWQSNPNKQAIIDSDLAPSNDKEAAIETILNPGAYTAIVQGVNATTGVGLVEVYDLDQTVDSKLANISTRGFVGRDENVMIGGIIVLGSQSANTLIRAIGPSLPLSGTLVDPTLELHDGNGAIIGSNDNWKDSQKAEIEATTIPPTNDAESAIVQLLPPGAYTAIVRGKNNNTGIALVEAYQLGN